MKSYVNLFPNVGLTITIRLVGYITLLGIARLFKTNA